MPRQSLMKHMYNFHRCSQHDIGRQPCPCPNLCPTGPVPATVSAPTLAPPHVQRCKLQHTHVHEPHSVGYAHADREAQVAALTASLADCHVEQQLDMDVCQPCSSTCLMLKRNSASSSDLIRCWLQASSWHLRRGLGAATGV